MIFKAIEVVTSRCVDEILTESVAIQEQFFPYTVGLFFFFFGISLVDKTTYVMAREPNKMELKFCTNGIEISVPKRWNTSEVRSFVLENSGISAHSTGFQPVEPDIFGY